MQELLEYAERRLEEEIKNGTESDIDYWLQYRDAVKNVTGGKRINMIFDEAVISILVVQVLKNQTVIMGALEQILTGQDRKEDVLNLMQTCVSKTAAMLGVIKDENQDS